jgi:hypothetical protein
MSAGCVLAQKSQSRAASLPEVKIRRIADTALYNRGSPLSFDANAQDNTAAGEAILLLAGTDCIPSKGEALQPESWL